MDPEHVVLDVLVVILEVFIASLNVIAIVELIETPVAALAGFVEKIVGGVESRQDAVFVIFDEPAQDVSKENAVLLFVSVFPLGNLCKTEPLVKFVACPDPL